MRGRRGRTQVLCTRCRERAAARGGNAEQSPRSDGPQIWPSCPNWWSHNPAWQVGRRGLPGHSSLGGSLWAELQFPHQKVGTVVHVAAQAVSGGGSADAGRREPDGRGVLSACPGSDGGQTEVLPVAFARGALGSVWGARSLEAPRGPWAAASRWRPQAGACAPSSPVPPAQPPL